MEALLWPLIGRRLGTLSCTELFLHEVKLCLLDCFYALLQWCVHVLLEVSMKIRKSVHSIRRRLILGLSTRRRLCVGAFSEYCENVCIPCLKMFSTVRGGIKPSNINRKMCLNVTYKSFWLSGGHSVSDMRIMIVISIHLLWDLLKTVFYFQFINYIFSLFSGVEPGSVVPGAASQPESRQPAWHGLHVRGQGHRRLLRRCRGRLSTLPRLRPGLRIRGQYQHTNIIYPFISYLLMYCSSCVVSISPWLWPSIHIHSRTLGKHCFGTFARLIMSL